MPGADLLDRLMAVARKAFGEWDEYPLYPIAYPWAAGRLQDPPPGSRVLDIGAGVSPLPLFLAEQGVLVDCVDKSPLTRTLPPGNDWNGWGFFDYAQLSPNIAAHNCAIEEFVPRHPFDAVYSISCLAHISQAVRDEALRGCRRWLRPGGIMLHAIEVIPASDFLWNRCDGQEIEPPVRHGTIADLADRLTALGFAIVERQVLRAIRGARTDLLLIACRAP